MQTLSPNEPTPESIGAGPTLTEGMRIGGCYSLRRDLSKPDGNAIWLANDEVLGKDVTLHFVPAAVVSDVRAMAELRQEVKRNRQLIHPNILRVYDLVEDGSCVAISMDCFEGETLAEHLKKNGRLDPDDVKPWVAQLAETLADAHRIQLFQRDLAPTNLYIRPGGGLLVTNFGISRVILNSLERAGIAKGEAARLAYLSPQQLDGERPAASDDIYGFGVLLYELLTGQPPFVGDNVVPQIRKAVPPPLSDVRSGSGPSSPVPASWQKLVAACLEKAPEMRPRNLPDVLALLAHDSGSSRAQASASGDPGPVEKSSSEATRETLDEGMQRAPVGNVGADIGSFENAAAGGRVENGGASDEVLHSASDPEKSEERSSGSKKHVETGIPPVPPGFAGSGTRKDPAKGALSSSFPDLDRPRSKAPLVWLLLAAGIIGTGIYVRNMPEETDGDADAAVARIDDPEELPRSSIPSDVGAPVGAPPSSPETLPDPVPVIPVTAGPSDPDAGLPRKVVATPAPKSGESPALISTEATPPVSPPATGMVPDTLVAASAGTGAKQDPDTLPSSNVKPPSPGKRPTPSTPVPPSHTPEPVVQTAKRDPLPVLPEGPKPIAKLALSAKPTLAELEQAKNEREAALKEIQNSAATADGAHQEMNRKLEAAKLQKDKLQKELDAKRKTLAPVIQQAETVEADQKKLQEEVAKAQAAASEAALAAEAAKRKYDEAVAKAGEKLTARQQAQAELLAVNTGLEAVGKDVEELSQLLTKADSLRQQIRSSQQQVEAELLKVSSSAEQARRAEMDIQRKANRGKIVAIEKQVKDLGTQVGRFKAALAPLKELGEVGKEASAKIEEKLSATNQQISDLQAEIKRLSGDTGALPSKATGTAKPPVPPPAKAETTDVAPPASQDGTFVNSLGMKFVPIGDVQFSVYLTTRKDFEAFAIATSLKSEAWRNPGFKQDPDHPVVNVTWREAEAFCKWLTEKERKAGLIKAGDVYRLPTDTEWSTAVGLPPENGATPELRDMGVQDIYPWGTQWPPPAGAGNYAGEETQTEIPIPNYNDGYANTSPVGKFPANKQGLHDMGGNVWQWVADYWNADNRARTLRGGSWYNGAIPLSLLSSCRISSSPDTLHDTYGFRIVKANEPSKGRRKN